MTYDKIKALGIKDLQNDPFWNACKSIVDEALVEASNIQNIDINLSGADFKGEYIARQRVAELIRMRIREAENYSHKM